MVTFVSARTEATRSRATSAERNLKGSIDEERGRVAGGTLCERVNFDETIETISRCSGSNSTAATSATVSAETGAQFGVDPLRACEQYVCLPRDGPRDGFKCVT